MTIMQIDKIRIIEAQALDSDRYFQSLLEQAYKKKLLNDSDMERLQYDCLGLLARQTERYNAGDSSSIPVEKAQEIMNSILFTIGLWLKTYPCPDDAVAALHQEPIDKLYQNGRRRIDRMLASAKTIHTKLLSVLLENPNEFYHSTIKEGIRGFFKLYRPDFAAQEIHITADYPVLNPMPKLEGIEFIQAYINSLYYENLFCGYFGAEAVHRLLCAYLPGYEDHLLNLYEPVLLAALGCTIAGGDISSLNLGKHGAAHLYRILSGLTEAELSTSVENALAKLVQILNCPEGLCSYLKNSLPLILSRIKIALQYKTLEQIFPQPHAFSD